MNAFVSRALSWRGRGANTTGTAAASGTLPSVSSDQHSDAVRLLRRPEQPSIVRVVGCKYEMSIIPHAASTRETALPAVPAGGAPHPSRRKAIVPGG